MGIQSRWDVLILGGGPSGLAAAIALRRISRLSVCVLEKSSSLRRRVGEILPPAIVEPLSALGLWDSFLGTGPTESAGVSVWWGNDRRYDWDYIRVPHGRGWHIDRMAFDAMLEQESEALGVVVMHGWKATDLEMNQNGPSRLLARVANGPPHVFAAAYVVDARGRSPSSLGPSHSWIKIDPLVGITRYYEQVHAEQSEPRLWIEATSRGWWYSAPLPNNRFIATYITDSDCCGRPIAQCFHSNLEDARMTKRRIGAAHEVTRTIVTPGHSGRSRHFASGTVIVIGDAAYSTDPARGHGLLNAMRHALAAATAIVRSDAGSSQSFAEYDARLTKEWGNYLVGRSWHYRSETRWQSKPFWARRIEDTQSG